MGLDMYLTKRTFIGNTYRNQKIEIKFKNNHSEQIIEPFKLNLDNLKSDRISTIIEDVFIWRNANQIHKWFIDNCQDGIDTNQETFISSDQLKQLLDVINLVLKNKKMASELLPYYPNKLYGRKFFNEEYFETLIKTKNMLVMEISESDSGSYYYRSSW